MNFTEMYIKSNANVIRMIAEEMNSLDEAKANASMTILVKEIERLQNMQ